MLQNPKEFSKLFDSNAKHNAKEENPFDDSDDGDDVGPVAPQGIGKKSKSKEEKLVKKYLEDGEEDSTEKLDLRRTLTAYITSARFSPFLKKIGYNTAYIKKLEKFDKDKLKAEIYKIKFIIRNRNSQKFYEELVFGLVYLVEQMSRGKLTGLTQLCRADDSFLDSIEEVRIETAGVFMIQSSKLHAAIVFLTKTFQAWAVNKVIQANVPAAFGQAQAQAQTKDSKDDLDDPKDPKDPKDSKEGAKSAPKSKGKQPPEKLLPIQKNVHRPSAQEIELDYDSILALI